MKEPDAESPAGLHAKRTEEAAPGLTKQDDSDEMLVLFDIDDTLLDEASAKRVAAAALHSHVRVHSHVDEFVRLWTDVSERHYARYLRGEVDFQGQRRARVHEAVDRTLSDADADDLFASYLRSYEDAWAPFSDVTDCLQALSGRHRLGVVSNGDAVQQRLKLEKLGIAHYFECTVVSDDIGCRKPAPRIFLEPCSRLRTSPEQALYVGDRYEIDVLGARAAGLTGVWLDRQGLRAGHHLPPIISSLDDLRSLLARHR